MSKDASSILEMHFFKKTKNPERDARDFEKSTFNRSLLRSSVSLAYFLPVNQVPERRNVIWASILVV